MKQCYYFINTGVKTSKDCRAGLHNGLWFYKFMLMLGLSVAVFFIPDPNGYFIKCKLL